MMSRRYKRRLGPVRTIAKGYCYTCGKVSFYTEKDAREEVRRDTALKHSYHCEITNTFHVTSMSQEEFVATGIKLHRDIENYLRHLWEQNKEYKVTSKKVIHRFPETKPNLIYSAISKMKKAGSIIALDEKVPGHNNAQYFALTSVIDEMTAADKKEETVDKIPAQVKVETPVADPFVKINDRLDHVSIALADILKVKNELRSVITEACSRSVVETNRYGNATLSNLDRVMLTVEQQSTDIRNLLKGETSDLKESLSDISEKLTAVILSQKSNNSDDYQRGLKDGIRLAVEMGLAIKSDDQV